MDIMQARKDQLWLPKFTKNFNSAEVENRTLFHGTRSIMANAYEKKGALYSYRHPLLEEGIELAKKIIESDPLPLDKWLVYEKCTLKPDIKRRMEKNWREDSYYPFSYEIKNIDRAKTGGVWVDGKHITDGYSGKVITYGYCANAPEFASNIFGLQNWVQKAIKYYGNKFDKEIKEFKKIREKVMELLSQSEPVVIKVEIPSADYIKTDGLVSKINYQTKIFANELGHLSYIPLGGLMLAKELEWKYVLDVFRPKLEHDLWRIWK